MILVLDEGATWLLERPRDLVLVERGGLQYYPAFAEAWPGRIGTLMFSRFSPEPPLWLWGQPSRGLVLFDKSTTTGLTLLKLRLHLAEWEPVVLGSFSEEHGRAGLPAVDLRCEVDWREGEVLVTRKPATLGGEYLLACDTPACARRVAEVVGAAVEPLPSESGLAALVRSPATAGPRVMDLAGARLERAFLPARVLRRPVVGVTLEPARHNDLCLVAEDGPLALTSGGAVRMGPAALRAMFGAAGG